MELEHEFTVPVPVEEAWPVLLDIERVAPCMPGATLDSVEGNDFTGRLKVKVGPITVTYRGTASLTHQDERDHAATIEASAKEARGPGTASATVNAALHAVGDNTRVTVHTQLHVTGRPAQFGRNVLSDVGAKLVGKFADCLAKELSGEQPVTATPTEEPASPAAQAGTAAAEAATTAGPLSSAHEGAGLRSEGVPASAPLSSPDGTKQHAADGHAGPRGEAPPHPRPSPTPQRTGTDAINLVNVAGLPVLKRVAPAAGAVLGTLAIVCLIRRRRKGRRR